MIIERLEVRGGFLHGLTLAFDQGLNVLIGPRGAGKTSVLELIRFAIGVPAMTAEAQNAADKQARAVLGDGTVTIYCAVQGQEIVLMRTALDDAPSDAARREIDPPLIVSQNEIEAIGLDPDSRRGILDRLLEFETRPSADRVSLRADVLRLQRGIEGLQRDREALADQVSRSAQLPQLLAEAEAEQAAAAADIVQAKPLQEAISALADELGRARSAGDAYRMTEEALVAWNQALSKSKLQQPVPKLHDAELSARVMALISSAERKLLAGLENIEEARLEVERARTRSRAVYESTQTKLKEQTEQLEALQQGAGEKGRRVSTLRQQLAERRGTTERIEQLDREIAGLLDRRKAALDELERASDAMFEARRSRAAAISAEFDGRIEVRVHRSAETNLYEKALASALQGSNLQYKALAAQVAPKLAPRELVHAVELREAKRLAKISEITDERAERLVAHLAGQPLGDVLAAELDDTVDFALLDGQDYKVTRQLSMGQRCTVVLPLLLAEQRESILLDQPEDHLDNAFIVETLVRAIRERAEDGQVLVATHNANVPVLGDAQRVVVLASDGRHGFVSTSGPLDDAETVQAITTLMEGGRDAFARRAAFYKKHPAQSRRADGRPSSSS
jgi:DNA repair ATPase RecN